MQIDHTSRGVVKRLQSSIDYASTFTHVELAHYLAEIVAAWCNAHPGTVTSLTLPDETSVEARAQLALGHAREVLNALYKAK